jgi:hypothetical protein
MRWLEPIIEHVVQYTGVYGGLGEGYVLTSMQVALASNKHHFQWHLFGVKIVMGAVKEYPTPPLLAAYFMPLGEQGPNATSPV